jgi:EpsD family peptidyl-prolyl cis-trans isomerase
MIAKKTGFQIASWKRRWIFARSRIGHSPIKLISCWFCFVSLVLITPQLGRAEPQALSSRIAASVNGAPITEADVDLMLKRSLKLGVVKEVSPAARKKLLEDLVYMRLAEQAIAEDSDAFERAEVQQELELTRLQMLLNVYLDAKATTTKTPTPEQIGAFIASHPQFFHDRRIYYFTRIDIDRRKQIDIAAIKTYAQSAKKQFSEAKSAEERDKSFSKLLNYTQAVAGKFSSMKGWKSTEEIDPSTFAHLQQMKDGEVLVDEVSDPDRIQVLMLQASQPVPIDADHSIQVATQMIRYDEKRRSAELLYNKLRAQADVRYGKDAQRITVEPSTLTTKHGSAPTAPDTFLRAFRWKHLWAAWIFALVILLPAALLHFHRKTIVQRESAYFVDEDFLSSIENRLRILSLTPAFVIVFAVAVSIVSLVTSSAIINFFGLFSHPTVVVTMALSGLVAAVLIAALWSTYASRLPTALSENRWLPIAGLLFIQSVGTLRLIGA